MNDNSFNEIIESIENTDMKEFAKILLKTIPEYFWIVPASSSLKHHGAYVCIEGGLARHTLALVRLLNYTLEIESIREQFTSRERDLMRIAGMMHDTRKSGSQEEWEADNHTKFEHPIMAAEVVLSFDNGKYIPHNELIVLVNLISSHMGQWSTSKYSDTVLPKPTTKMEIMVHQMDYLASRKDIEVHCEMNNELKIQ